LFTPDAAADRAVVQSPKFPIPRLHAGPVRGFLAAL
jgi:hypothetical protein